MVREEKEYRSTEQGARKRIGVFVSLNLRLNFKVCIYAAGINFDRREKKTCIN